MLRVESQNGLIINDAAHRRGKMVMLSDGDVIQPLVREPGSVAVRVQFETQHDEVHRITLQRLLGPAGS